MMKISGINDYKELQIPIFHNSHSIELMYPCCKGFARKPELLNFVEELDTVRLHMVLVEKLASICLFLGDIGALKKDIDIETHTNRKRKLYCKKTL